MNANHGLRSFNPRKSSRRSASSPVLPNQITIANPPMESRPMPMLDPAHPGEIVRECMEAEGWTVAECAGRLRVNRVTLSRLLNGRAGVSPTMALERIGWSNADHWVRMQGSYGG